MAAASFARIKLRVGTRDKLGDPRAVLNKRPLLKQLGLFVGAQLRSADIFEQEVQLLDPFRSAGGSFAQRRHRLAQPAQLGNLLGNLLTKQEQPAITIQHFAVRTRVKKREALVLPMNVD